MFIRSPRAFVTILTLLSVLLSFSAVNADDGQADDLQPDAGHVTPHLAYPPTQLPLQLDDRSPQNRRAVLPMPSYGYAPTSPADDSQHEEGSASLATSVEPLPTDRLIVRLTPIAQAQHSADLQQAAASLSQVAGEPLQYVRATSDGALVLALPERKAYQDVAEIARRLTLRPDIEYAEPDAIMQPALEPNDPRYPEQWHYRFQPGQYGINLPLAWDITTGSASVVAAVLDTGILPHADMVDNLIFVNGQVYGYDFISDPWMARDGNGRDPNPRDEGDWLDGSENCGAPSNSSWHGLHVAGTIAARGNNGIGVTGVSWNSKILPVRVLGRCGGYVSDIADGMRWAAGLSVPGAPNNQYPARVLNLSLGGFGPCSATFQNAINEILASTQASIVVAAGNSGMNVINFQPASCDGVITVAAASINGNRASYSNYGNLVDISAPGGSFGAPILSLLNTGTTAPGSDSYAGYQGTSMATPHVSGVIALMLSANPNLTRPQVLTVLQQTARPFPQASSCREDLCGAGILDAGAAVIVARNLPSATLTVNKSGSGSGTVTSNPAGIDCGAACTYAFPTGTTVTLTATPDTGYTFSGWSGACSGTDPCTVTLAEDRTVTAIFNRSDQQLTIVKTGSGNGTITSDPAGIACNSTCSTLFPYGTLITLNAVPAPGHTFAGWVGACTGTGLSCTVTMIRAHTVGAVFTAPPSSGAVLYAAPVATGAGNCSSWQNACTLYTALQSAGSSAQIWVKAGVHKPTTNSNDRTASFVLKNGVALYGGFAGNEINFDQRNPSLHVTILSGDIDNNDDTDVYGATTSIRGANSYRVVRAVNVNETTVLDGFVITGGQANSMGGGMEARNSRPTIVNVVFKTNSASYGGGGMMNDNSQPILESVVFTNNSAYAGGGLNNYNSNAVMNNVLFENNQSSFGGGVYNYRSQPVFTQTRFVGNRANQLGGGVYNHSSHPIFEGTSFTDNAALLRGGGVANYQSNPVFNDTTFDSNTEEEYGGGIYNQNSDIMLVNVKFTRNSSIRGGGVYNGFQSKLRINSATFRYNYAENNGEAVSNWERSYSSIHNAIFDSNTSISTGGDISRL